MKRVFRVTGCGVSVICEEGEAMLGWIKYMVQHGGVPTIHLLAQETPEAA